VLLENNENKFWNFYLEKETSKQKSFQIMYCALPLCNKAKPSFGVPGIMNVEVLNHPRSLNHPVHLNGNYL